MHADQRSSDGPESRDELLFDLCFSPAQAAQLLGVSTSTVRRMLANGTLEHERVAERRFVIRRSTLEAYRLRSTEGSGSRKSGG